MKKILLILIGTSLSISASAQRVGQLWSMRFDFQLVKKTGDDKVTLKKDRTFRIVEEHSDYFIVQVLLADESGYKRREKKPYKGSSDKLEAKINTFNDKIVFEDSDRNEVVDYKIGRQELTYIAKQVVARLQPAITIASIPFKRRRIAKEFTTELSLMAMSGIRVPVGRSEFSFSLQFGIGLSSIDLHPDNSSVTNVNDQNAATLTVPLGVMFHWDFIEVGIFQGWDFLQPRNRVSWEDNGVPWWGIGIGVSLFNQNLARSTTASNKG